MLEAISNYVIFFSFFVFTYFSSFFIFTLAVSPIHFIVEDRLSTLFCAFVI